MIDKLIERSVQQKGLTLMLTLVVIFFGWMSFKSLPIDAVPDITNVQVQINTAVSGLIPEEIETFVTYPVESGMGGIPGVDQIRSVTRFGLSQVSIIFAEGTDIFRARQLVAEKLQTIQDQLPAGIQPKMGPITTGLGEIYFYSLDAKIKANDPLKRLEQLMELRSVNEWIIKPRLLTVKGVAEVNVIGGFQKGYYVQPRLNDLAKYGLHIHELVAALEANNRNTGGGYIQQTSEKLLVQATGLVKSIKDIESIVIKKLPNLQTVRIKDVANVALDKELRTGAATVDGQEAVIGTILMLLGENSRTVSTDVGNQIEAIKASLPDWVEFEPLYDRSILVNRTLFTVEQNLLHGAALVALILLLLIGDVRVAVITAITIPLALMVTFILMKYFNVSGNLMSLGALDFGIIIDGAVIVMDNCVQHISAKAKQIGRPLSRPEIQKAVIRATKEIRAAAGFGQLIIIMVFIPIFALTGVEAKMFIPMASTFCFALAGAFLFSFSTIPALAGAFLSGKVKQKQPWIMRGIEALYIPTLKVALKMRTAIILFGIAAIAGGGYMLNGLGSDFLPQLEEGSIALQIVRPTNISIDQSVELQKISERLILEFPEVSKVLSRIGTAEVATDPMGPNISDTYALLNPIEMWPVINGKQRTKLDLIVAIKESLEESVPGQSLIFSQPIQLRFNELLEGVRADVSLKIFGEDLDQISAIGAQAAEVIQQVPGAGDVEEETKGKSPVLRINPKNEALYRLGIPKDNVLSAVETAIGGTEAGHLFQGVMRFPIVVRLGDKDRSSLDSIRKIPVGINVSSTAPMDQLADVSIQETYGDIRREASKKRVAVLINVRGRDTASFVQAAKLAVEKEIKLPPGVYMEWGGSFKNLEKAKNRLSLVVPLALLLVFMMIYMAFKSVLQTLMIFACIPMALFGGVAGLMFNGLEFSISAAIGFIALSGIAVLNGIVLVSYFNRLKLDGFSGDDLIIQGTIMRLRPVLMTATSAAFGFLPMMLSTGAGAEVQRPLASVVVGGIISATALTLIVLPIVYRTLESKMKVVDSGMSH